MAGYRWDAMSGSWVLIAPARGGVPRGRSPLAGLPAMDGSCPFCPGNEAETEAALLSVPHEACWAIRVVGNRYPAVSLDAPDAEHDGDTVERRGYGTHEVVIEAREHDLDIATMDPDHLIEVLRVYRRRLQALQQTPGIAHVSAFRNRGRLAGSSQPHPHGQMLASAVVGPYVQARQACAEAHAERHGESLLEAVVRHEQGAQVRLVDQDDEWLVFCPFAAHRPFETWIVPRRSAGSFTDSDDAQLRGLAQRLPSITRAVLERSGQTDYTLLWRLPPVGARAPAAFWYLELHPRGGGAAGFELSTGINLVPVPPEGAAAEIREALASSSHRLRPGGDAF